MKIPPKPKKHRKLRAQDLRVLKFVVETCCAEEPPLAFPSKAKGQMQWDDFCVYARGLNAGIIQLHMQVL